MPYVMLQGIRKKAKQREERREGMEAEAGVITGKAVGSARRASAATNRARGGGGQRGSDSSRGGNGRSSSAGCVSFCHYWHSSKYYPYFCVLCCRRVVVGKVLP